MADIQQLLRKRSWTGKEVGEALLASMLNDIKNQGKPHNPLFSQAQFDKMENSLSSERDYLVYSVYKDMNSAILDSFNRGQGLFQQFYNGYSRLFTDLQEIQHTEDAKYALTQCPLTVTAEQYKRLETKARQARSTHQESFCSLVFHILNMMVKAKPILPLQAIELALHATKSQLAVNPNYIALYQRTFKEGYYSLPDGRTSNTMTKAEWFHALQELYIDSHTKNSDSREDVKTYYNTIRRTKNYELFFKGAQAIREKYRTVTGQELEETDSELLDAVNDIIDDVQYNRYHPIAQKLERAFDNNVPTEWHFTLPKVLTQYDLLAVYILQNKQNEKQRFTDFQIDYPDLYATVKDYIQAWIPSVRSLREDEWFQNIISWGELEQLGMLGYEHITAPTAHDIIAIFTAENADKHSGRTGIAILQNPKISQVDENGDYLQPRNIFKDFQNLDSVANDKEHLWAIQSYKKQLIAPALSYFYAFHSLMEIVESVYNINNLAEIARFDTTVLENKITLFNNLLYIFYHTICEIGEEREKNRNQVKAIFSPLDIRDFQPTQERINAVRNDIVHLTYDRSSRKKLRYFDTYIRYLMGEGAL